MCYEPASASMTTARPTAGPGTVLSLLDAAAARVPTRRAVVDEHGALDYRSLAARVAAAAAALRSAGIGRSDRVAIALPNGVAFVESFLGVLAAGATAFPVPAAARGESSGASLPTPRSRR